MFDHAQYFITSYLPREFSLLESRIHFNIYLLFSQTTKDNPMILFLVTLVNCYKYIITCLKILSIGYAKEL